MGKIIGIDLGTTNCAFAVMDGSEPRILENAEGARTTPSIIAQSKTGERLVGLLAKRQAVTNPDNTVYGVKRFIGHRFDEKEVQKDKETVPYKISKSDDGGVLMTMGGKTYRPEEMSAMILQKIKTDAEAKLGEPIEGAIITVPAYFNDSQRKATRDAGKIAGLDVQRIINEPTAAALAYGFNKKKDEQIVVFDFGGGTFDISVLEVGDDVVEVKSTDGDAHMGGKDIDQKIITWIAEEFKKESGIDVRKDPLALQRLDESAEKAKVELSTTTEAEINIPFITSDASGPKHLLLKMTRAVLEDISREFIDRSIEITKRAIDASPFKMEDIDEIVLVGGQTRMPAIHDAVKKLFNKEPNKSINPDEVVALGAALQGGIIKGDVKDVLLLDVIPLSLGIETMGGVATKLIDRNTTIPTSKSQIFSTASDNQTSVDIHIIQGERSMVADNKSLGRFILDGITTAPRGMPQIEVSFDVDANGILSVKAKDKATNKEQSIRIEASSGLSDADIERMKTDADANSAEDAKKKEEAEARNLADSLLYTAEKTLKDNTDKIPTELKTSVEEKISALKKAKEEGKSDVIKTTSEALSAELQKIGEHVYKQTQENEAKSGEASKDGASDTTDGSKSNEARDAEFEEGSDKTDAGDDDSTDNSGGEKKV